jgi:cysteine-rich repeat protein
MLLASVGPARAWAQVSCGPPVDGCRQSTAARKGTLLLRDRSPDQKDQLVWQWKRGNATTFQEFGSDEDVVLCLYEEGSSVPILEATAPFFAPGCPTTGCWQAFDERYREYKNTSLEPDGLRLVRLQTGDEGKARITVRGEGDNLDMPALPLALPVRAQLRCRDPFGQIKCWEGRFSQFVLQNQDANLFKAKADFTACADAAAPACDGVCPTGHVCVDPGAGCTCRACDRDLTLDPGEECDDGNLTGGDGCSGVCECNPATTPDVCNLTGDWVVYGYSDVVTITEDAAGNSTSSGTIAGVAFTGQATRTDSCGTGSAELVLGGGSVPVTVRSMVHDSCDAITTVIPAFINFPIIPPVTTLVRVTSSPSGAFLEREHDVVEAPR